MNGKTQCYFQNIFRKYLWIADRIGNNSVIVCVHEKHFYRITKLRLRTRQLFGRSYHWFLHTVRLQYAHNTAERSEHKDVCSGLFCLGNCTTCAVIRWNRDWRFFCIGTNFLRIIGVLSIFYKTFFEKLLNIDEILKNANFLTKRNWLTETCVVDYGCAI